MLDFHQAAIFLAGNSLSFPQQWVYLCCICASVFFIVAWLSHTQCLSMSMCDTWCLAIPIVWFCPLSFSLKDCVELAEDSMCHTVMACVSLITITRIMFLDNCLPNTATQRAKYKTCVWQQMNVLKMQTWTCWDTNDYVTFQTRSIWFRTRSFARRTFSNFELIRWTSVATIYLVPSVFLNDCMSSQAFLNDCTNL